MQDCCTVDKHIYYILRQTLCLINNFFIMKKEASFYLFLLVMLAFGIQTKAANIVQVGEIGGWSQKVVMSLSSSHFETIYPSDLLSGLGGPCEISELAFPYYQSGGGSHTGGHTGNVKIYLANTTDAEVATAFTDISTMTLVYDGASTWEGGSEDEPQWNKYTLSTPFKYTGRNLRIFIDKNAGNYSAVYFGAQTNLNIPCLFQDAWTSDWSNTEYVNKMSRNTNVMPVTKFTFTPTTSGTTLVSSVYNWKLGNATIGQTYTQTVTVTGQRLNGAVTITPSSKGLVSVSETEINQYAALYGKDITLSVTPQDDQETEDYVTISTDGADPIKLNVVWTPKWPRPGTSVQVGEDNSALSDFRIPAKLNSLYSKSEMIYKADDLNLGNNCQISKIAFAYAKDMWSSLKPEIPANVKIYLQNTEATEVGSAITDVTTMTKVYEGNVTYVGTGTPSDPIWLGFEFNQPFEYTGGALRVVYENTNEIEKTCSYYFRDDYNKHRKALLAYGSSANRIEASYDGQAFPIMKVYSESSIKADPEKVEVGEVALYTPYEKEITLNVLGELNNGITVSAPTTNVVKVSKTTFTNQEIIDANGQVKFTVTITPEETTTSKDQIVISSRGLDDIVMPITWTPILGYKAAVHTIGEINDISMKVPLFSTWECSESEFVYKASDLNLKKGANIRRIEFPIAFNSNAVSEDLTVSLSNTTDAEVGETFTEDMTQVAKITKVIPAGGQVEAAAPFYYLTFDIRDGFVYDGSNLRLRIKGVSAETSQEWHFSIDSKRRGELPVLIRFAEKEAQLAGCSTETNSLYRTKAAFPVIRITTEDNSSETETTFDTDSYSWVNGNSEVGKEYTKVVKISAKNLNGDIAISTPDNKAVTIDKTTIAKNAAEAGTAEFTITLKATELGEGVANFTLTSDGADAIEFPVYWKGVEPDIESAQAGTISNWYPYMPLDLGSPSSHSEFVYRAADLGLDGMNKYISRIAYPYYQYALHGDADPMTTKVTIYVANTTDNDVPNDDEGFTDVSTMTKVYEGEYTFKEGSQKAPQYATFEFAEKFLYTGNNLRVVCLHECDVENTSDFNKIFFAQDADKANNQYSLLTVGDIGDVRYRTGSYYPVAKFFVEDAPTVRLSENKVEFTKTEVGNTYTKNIALTAANLIGDIIVSDPTSSDITIAPTVISKEVAESGNAVITVTFKPTTSSVGTDAVELFTEGGETITLPISWDVVSGIEDIDSTTPYNVEVIDLSGRHIMTTTVLGDLYEALRGKIGEGVYLVKTGNKVYKLNIKK